MNYQNLLARTAVLGFAALLVMCSSTEKADSAGLMIEIINDGTVSVNRLSVNVKRGDGTVALDGHYDNPKLPNTIGLTNPQAGGSAEIAISAFRADGEPVERRDYSVQNIPTEHVVGLRVVLSGGCTPPRLEGRRRRGALGLRRRHDVQSPYRCVSDLGHRRIDVANVRGR